jgi:hypothetical protein
VEAAMTARNPNDYGVVLGITRYPALGDLQGCENDAVAFGEWLASDVGGGLPAANITVLRSSDHPAAAQSFRERPTLQDVDQAFEPLIELAMQQGGRAGRRLYVFMAGHGLAPDIDDAALFMANADAQIRIANHVPGRPYASWFRMGAVFDEVVLFMDCCRDDYQSVPFRSVPWAAVASREGADTRHLFGFATRWSRKSRERPDDTGVVRGLFSRALLAGLKGGAADFAGQISGASLEGFVFSYLQSTLQAEDYQEPRFDYDKMNDVVLVPADPVRRKSTHRTVPVVIEIAPPQVASASVINEAFTEVARASRPLSSWTIRLHPGRYQVRLPGPREKVFDVIAGEGIRVQL